MKIFFRHMRCVFWWLFNSNIICAVMLACGVVQFVVGMHRARVYMERDSVEVVHNDRVGCFGLLKQRLKLSHRVCCRSSNLCEQLKNALWNGDIQMVEYHLTESNVNKLFEAADNSFVTPLTCIVDRHHHNTALLCRLFDTLASKHVYCCTGALLRSHNKEFIHYVGS
jgi:hypothetical protein